MAGIYFPAIDGPWLFDDVPNLLENSALHRDFSEFDSWRAVALSTNAGPLGRPISSLSFAVNASLNPNLGVTGFKATNVLIHLVIAACVYLFLSNALSVILGGDSRAVATLAAVLWALHPLHVSTVLYVVQRMAQLSMLFMMAGLALYAAKRVAWIRDGASKGEIVSTSMTIAIITILAGLSKENGLLLPLLIAVSEVFLFKGVVRGRVNQGLVSIGWITIVSSVIVTLYLGNSDRIPAGYAARDFTLEERVLTQSRLWWFYAGLIVFPRLQDMGLFHDDFVRSSGIWEPITTGMGLLGLALVVTIVVAKRRTLGVVAFGVFFFLTGHLMESSVLPLEMAFEHRNYLPSAGLVVCVSWIIVVLSKKLSVQLPTMRTLLPVLATAALAILLVFRVLAWTSELQLAATSAENHPESPRSRHFYATALLKEFAKNVESSSDPSVATELLFLARSEFEELHMLQPVDTSALVSLITLDARYFSNLGMYDEWIRRLELALDRPVLDVSDVRAVETVLECAAARECLVAAQQIENIVILTLRNAARGDVAQERLRPIVIRLIDDDLVRRDRLVDTGQIGVTESDYVSSVTRLSLRNEYGLIVEHLKLEMRLDDDRGNLPYHVDLIEQLDRVLW